MKTTAGEVVVVESNHSTTREQNRTQIKQKLRLISRYTEESQDGIAKMGTNDTLNINGLSWGMGLIDE